VKSLAELAARRSFSAPFSALLPVAHRLSQCGTDITLSLKQYDTTITRLPTLKRTPEARQPNLGERTPRLARRPAAYEKVRVSLRLTAYLILNSPALCDLSRPSIMPPRPLHNPRAPQQNRRSRSSSSPIEIHLLLHSSHRSFPNPHPRYVLLRVDGIPRAALEETETERRGRTNGIASSDFVPQFSAERGGGGRGAY
jgi:hypothetical protein